MIRDLSESLHPETVRTGGFAAPVFPLLLAGPWLFDTRVAFSLSWLALFSWAAFRARRQPRAAVLLGLAGVAGTLGLLLPTGPWTLVAALVATGAVPFHLWMEGARRSLPASEFQLLLVVQPAAAWMHRFAEEHPEMLHGAWGTALLRFFVVSALVHAGLSLVRTEPTRAIASVVSAQASLVLAGAAAGGVGWAGARAMLLSTAIGATVLLSVLDERRDVRGVETDPALHRLYLAAGWLLVGLPGGLAFFAEDLLFHALLERSTAGTMAFVVAAGLGVVGFFRSYVETFTGPVREVVPADPGPDRGRPYRLAVLTGLVLLLVAGGVMPGPLMH